MIRNVWAVFCRTVLEDRRTEALSLIHAIQRITVSGPPDPPPQIAVSTDLAVASMWYNSDAKNEARGKFSLAVTTPSGQEVKQVTHNLKIGPGEYYRWIVLVNRFEVTGPGLYQIILRVKDESDERWRRGATVPFDVVYNLEEPEQNENGDEDATE